MNYTHGGCAGNKSTTEYTSWLAMRKRCTKKDCADYRNYGGRGIAVCDRWVNSFENFISDMGTKPTPFHSIDRFPDINGNYEPSNCRWADKKQQANGRRTNRILFYNGENKNLSEWCEILSCRHTDILKQLNRKTFPEIVSFYLNKKQISTL